MPPEVERALLSHETPEELEAQRNNQAEFCEFFGPDYAAYTFEEMWIGASPDGAFIAFYWKARGQKFKVTIPADHSPSFMTSFMVAAKTAADRLTKPPKGRKAN